MPEHVVAAYNVKLGTNTGVDVCETFQKVGSAHGVNAILNLPQTSLHRKPKGAPHRPQTSQLQ